MTECLSTQPIQPFHSKFNTPATPQEESELDPQEIQTRKRK